MNVHAFACKQTRIKLGLGFVCKGGVPTGCAQILVCYAHQYWCAMHTNTGVHSTPYLVCYAKWGVLRIQCIAHQIWCARTVYDLPFLMSRKLQTHGHTDTHTHTQNTDKTEKRKRIRRKNKLPSPSDNRRVQSTNTVVNLLQMPLSEDEMSLVSKGLSFCPKPRRINTFQLKQDFKDYTRRLRLREYFSTHWMRT